MDETNHGIINSEARTLDAADPVRVDAERGFRPDRAARGLRGLVHHNRALVVRRRSHDHGSHLQRLRRNARAGRLHRLHDGRAGLNRRHHRVLRNRNKRTRQKPNRHTLGTERQPRPGNRELGTYEAADFGGRDGDPVGPGLRSLRALPLQHRRRVHRHLVAG
jgi:hypothetical protein